MKLDVEKVKKESSVNGQNSGWGGGLGSRVAGDLSLMVTISDPLCRPVGLIRVV